MNANIARIVVQKPFVGVCETVIKPALEQIICDGQVVLYPTDATVVFSFKKAVQVSDVLNMLTDLGFPPAGDRVATRLD